MSAIDLSELRRVWHDLGVLLGEIKHEEEAEADAERAERF